MRYQEPIYIQNENSGVRNRDILNVNMSSDICFFEAPSFIISGASKLNCTGGTNTQYLVSTATTIPLSFDFTANTSTFTATNATFKYEIYKYNKNVSGFTLPPIYISNIYEYSTFSGISSNILYQDVPINSLNLDGEYLVKGYYTFDACTEFLNKLGKKVDTLSYMNGSEYGLYDKNLDYYFLAIKSAEKPIFLNNSSNTPPANQLFQQVLQPSGGLTNIVITNTYAGNFIFTLNGLVLAQNLDYTYSGSIVTLNSPTVEGDIITIIYTTIGGNNLIGDNIYINVPVVSGTSNNQGTNTAYFNTTTNKFEVYTVITPATGGSIIVMLNGATLANGVDFYQSTSNPKRIILEGDLQIGDVITISYFPVTSVVNGLITSNPSVTWSINSGPQLINGNFTLEVSTGSTFSTLYSSGLTEYVVGQTIYNNSFIASGNVGTTLYYRVKNNKDYVDLCGNIVNTVAYSDVIPVVIQTNSINSY